MTPTQSSNQISRLNHIIIMVQENRSFDHYFGQLSLYWAANGFPSQPLDGLPTRASNPGCDPASPPPRQCVVGPGSPVAPAYHLNTVCIESPRAAWNESHLDFNRVEPANGPAQLDGFVLTAAAVARISRYHDTGGRRVMGFYDGHDLNYYYFMASSFATSDRWFAPVMAQTAANRMFLLAGTSHGHVYPLKTSASLPLTDKTIFQLLEENGISWKIYVHPGVDGCTTASCLANISYINMFKFKDEIVTRLQRNIAPISEYFRDVANGNLPQVALIEPASSFSLDEHPSLTTPVNSQVGAKYVSVLMNALMQSPSWKDSAFILTFDEFGGFYDHVAPQPTVSPDGIMPSDLSRNDVCVGTGGANCDFKQTGYRVPLIVISPFTKKNFVSHTPADYTAILKLIERRFNLPSLTARDAVQMDMTEFFDFANPPWMIPPSPPAQNIRGNCYLNHLP